ncbi:MAG: hypothetical protein K2X44_03130, partial [Magnetospirillum sp.]|nr:hypothetical protein [Magnetospirillum sp.]
PAACVGLPRCISAMRQHYWMIWTNLTLLRDWMFDENVKLLHAAYHMATTPRDKFIANAKTLQAAGQRIICKILTPPDREKEALELFDELAALGLPPVLVPIENQTYTHLYSQDFLRKVVTSHLVSTMFNGRFFRSPIESKMCAAGTQESILVMSDGTLLRCAAAQWSFTEQQGETTTQVIPHLEAPAFLIKPERCITPHGCWCEPNHYGLTARGNENERIEHYVNTGEWNRPSAEDLLAFLETSGWNAQIVRSLMEG